MDIGAGRPAKLLVHFGIVAVPADLVCLEGFGHLAEHRPQAGRTAGAADAGFGVGHQAVRFDQTRFEERHQRQQNRGRIATGIADHRRLRYRVGIYLG